MRIAFIVQRYGTEIPAGSAYHCRLVAELLSTRHDVEVLTTCAREDTTWENAYPEGSDRVRGVTVRRFPNDETRDPEAFRAFSDWLFTHPHGAADEEKWLREQGPWCPALVEHLEREHGSYDALVFFDCLYAPTVLGVRIAPRHSILVPAARDEPAIRLAVYRNVFTQPAALAYSTAVERGFLRRRFAIPAAAQAVVGCGVELPPPRKPAVETEASDGGEMTPGAVFRRRHRLFDPFVLYRGRIDPGRGCEELIAYFRAYAETYGDAKLALMGAKLMPIPEHPSIRFAGVLSEIERLEALEAAAVVVVPAPHESLSLLALEAFAAGSPILVNARSDVLTDHCQRSNAGLYYGSREEFVECLRLLMGDGELRSRMGRLGRAYVEENYSWNVVLDKFEHLIHGVARRRTAPGSQRGRGRSGRGRTAARPRRA